VGPGASDAELNQIGVLRRREIEARVLAPLLEAFGREFGRERVLEVARDVIVELAQAQGREVARTAGGDDIAALAGALEPWTRNGSLEMRTLRRTERELHFDVTRCRYAEMYRALGIPELGAVLSCNRDFAFGSGFNPRLRLRRTQTIMEGAPHCDFRFTLAPDPPAAAGDTGP
jgi:hypothetical protein